MVDELGFIEIHDVAMHDDFSDVALVWVLDPTDSSKRLDLFREIKDMNVSRINNKIFLWILLENPVKLPPLCQGILTPSAGANCPPFAGAN